MTAIIRCNAHSKEGCSTCAPMTNVFDPGVVHGAAGDCGFVGFHSTDLCMNVSPEIAPVIVTEASEEQRTFREGAKTLLQEADAIINGERQKDYGPPGQSFEGIAKSWSVYLDKDITALDVANLMILLKVSRAKTGGFHRDSYVDVAGYAGCAEWLGVEK